MWPIPEVKGLHFRSHIQRCSQRVLRFCRNWNSAFMVSPAVRCSYNAAMGLRYSHARCFNLRAVTIDDNDLEFAG